MDGPSRLVVLYIVEKEYLFSLCFQVTVSQCCMERIQDSVAGCGTLALGITLKK